MGEGSAACAAAAGGGGGGARDTEGDNQFATLAMLQGQSGEQLGQGGCLIPFEEGGVRFRFDPGPPFFPLTPHP